MDWISFLGTLGGLAGMWIEFSLTDLLDKTMQYFAAKPVLQVKPSQRMIQRKIIYKNYISKKLLYLIFGVLTFNIVAIYVLLICLHVR